MSAKTASERIAEYLRINPDKETRRIGSFISEVFRKAGANWAIIGMSGGVDSSVVASLAARALGGKSVLGISLPESNVTDPHDVADAREVATSLGIRFRIIEISPAIQSLMGILPDKTGENPLPLANLKPRIRMTVLYYYANLLNGVVLGCGNRSEIRAGYFTKFGDGGADLLPIGHLYKTQVLQLAGYLGVPRHIIGKKPSAGLWRGQTDEGELGIPYEKLDVIYAGLDLKLRPATIARCAGVDQDTVIKFIERERRTEHKLAPPTLLRP
ncbi:MAG: NAD+ synthase [Candidatus Hadarchaeales archaeon]